MDCCNGWFAEKFHGDECPAFNHWMDETNTFETYLRNTPQFNEEAN